MSVKYAYGYVRVSTDKQEELSPDSQEKLLREYAAKNKNGRFFREMVKRENGILNIDEFLLHLAQRQDRVSENDRSCKIIRSSG